MVPKQAKAKTARRKRTKAKPPSEIVLLTGSILKFRQRFPTGWGAGLMQHDGKWLTVTGTFPSWVVVGTHATFMGRFVQHATFGLQFELSAVSRSDHADYVVQLVAMGIPAELAAHAVAVFGVAAEQELRLDPYRLCHAGLGVTFREVDALASKVLLLPVDHSNRLQRAIATILESHLATGHCYMLQATVIAGVLELLSSRPPTRAALAAALDDASFEDSTAPFRVYYEPSKSAPHAQVQLERIAVAEDNIARKIVDLLREAQV